MQVHRPALAEQAEGDGVKKTGLAHPTGSEDCSDAVSRQPHEVRVLVYLWHSRWHVDLSMSRCLGIEVSTDTFYHFIEGKCVQVLHL